MALDRNDIQIIKDLLQTELKVALQENNIELKKELKQELKQEWQKDMEEMKNNLLQTWEIKFERHIIEWGEIIRSAYRTADTIYTDKKDFIELKTKVDQMSPASS